jgi:1,5-anhydro-D-fructose reductase (1,5-anhydro-D-mannitol-forming)
VTENTGHDTQAAGRPPTRPFTIGLVGASNIAMTWMLPAFAALGIEVRGLYDNEPRRFAYWTSSGVEGVTTNLGQLLASDIDAVYISTRNDQHLAEAVAAAEAGKHILVEKPMALSIADAQTMIDAARRHGVVLAVNHHLVGSPLHVTARQLVADGRIGRLVGARINNAGTLPAHLRGWRLSGAPGAGVILDLTVHDASILNPLFGAQPLEVTAMAATQAAWNDSSAADSVMTLIRYGHGSSGIDRLAFAHDSFTVAAPSSYLEILGDGGAIVIRDAMNQDTAGTVELHTSEGRAPVDVDCSDDLYQILLSAFLDAIQGDGRPTVTGAEGLLALQVALAAEQSAAEGRTVRLSDLH